MHYYPRLKNEVLLTGAGFSASIGGYLAYEMWAKLFNHPSLENRPRVKALMRDRTYEFDYERIYQEIVIEDKLAYLDSDAKLAVSTAMHDTMKDLITQVQDYRNYKVFLNVQQLMALIKYFSGAADIQGAIFSTNQDIFMESLCWHGHSANKHMIRHPGLKEYSYGKQEVLIPETISELEQEISQLILSQEPHLNYCKLHGSWAWQHSNSSTHTHVTGLNKLDTIRKEPLLNWYYELFRTALLRPDVKLLVIGYRFADPHINSVILNAIKEYQLKVYIIDPTPPSQFNAALLYPQAHESHLPCDNGLNLWEGVEAYLPYTLQKVFPPTREPAMLSSPARDLNKLFPFMNHFNDFEVKNGVAMTC